MTEIEFAMAADKLARTMARLSRQAEAHPIGATTRPAIMKSLLDESVLAIGEFENFLRKDNGGRKR